MQGIFISSDYLLDQMLSSMLIYLAYQIHFVCLVLESISKKDMKIKVYKFHMSRTIVLTLWTAQYLVVCIFLFRKYYLGIDELNISNPFQAIVYTLMSVLRVVLYAFIGLKVFYSFRFLYKEKSNKLQIQERSFSSRDYLIIGWMAIQCVYLFILRNTENVLQIFPTFTDSNCDFSIFVE